MKVHDHVCMPVTMLPVKHASPFCIGQCQRTRVEPADQSCDALARLSAMGKSTRSCHPARHLHSEACLMHPAHLASVNAAAAYYIVVTMSDRVYVHDPAHHTASAELFHS